jgi:hypothetical protein
MRRFVFTLAATGLLFVFAPAGAFARHHHHHGQRHSSRSHHVRIRRFGDVSGQSTTTSSPDNVGTVASFTNGVLTIQLNDNSTVSGTVTNDTEIECTASGQSQSIREDGDTSGDDQGDQSSSGDDQGEDQGSTSDDQGEDQGSTSDDQGEDQGSTSEDQGEDQNEATSSCSSADLTPGKVVHAAELRITSAGKAWKKVELGS